jgi:hypothetical protein
VDSGADLSLSVRRLLVGLAAIADLGIGLPYFLAKLAGAGAGNVIAITYEYGNTYVIVAGC